MNNKPADDEARDAHLLAALSHAPDRDVAPPANVSAAILGQAQAALRPPRTRAPSWLEGLRAALLRGLRPAPMAAFGTVAMATLIGVMWSGHEPPEATPSLRPQTVAATPPTVPAPADAPPAAQAPSVQRQTAPPLRPTSPPAVRAQPQARALPQAQPAATTITQPQAAEPAPTVAAAARPDALREPVARGDATAKSMADAAPAARSRTESATAALGAAMPAAASPLAAPTVDLEAAVRSDATRVRWQLTQGRLVAHGAVQRDWWSALARATQGAWQRAAHGTPGQTEGAPVVLVIDGAPRGSLAFEPNHLVWREPGGQAWRAPVAADTLRDWQEAVRRW